ncbi:MAG: molybdopterin-dependent oxidoreductase, partial [Chrysiogenetes bacterium]|nr:molybdopterin-dependent oxidoreductase [Chrysiogenetes bacterium]
MGVINGPAQVSENAKNLPTVCVLCSHNCAMRVDVENNEITKVRADESSPLTRGYSCNKGYRIAYYVNHKQRVEYPMKRRADGSFERISWDQAITEISSKLKAIRARHPGRSVALAGIGGQGNHMDGPFAIPFLMGVGSDIIFNSLGQEKTQHPLVDGWMFGASPESFLHADAEHAEYLLMLGTNPVVSNRGERATETIKELRQNEARTLVVVDPRRTETTRRANAHLRIKPGMDVYFMLGMCAHIEREGLTDKKFIGKYTKDYEKLRQVLRGIDLDEMAARTGLDVSEITRTAEGFARAKSAAVFMDLGAEQIPYSTLMSYLVRVLVLMTGNVGKKGGQVFLPMFMAKSPTMAKPGFPKALASDIPAIPMFSPFGWLSPNLLPEEILVDHPARIRALIVEGANPLVSYADSQLHREAFKKLDLLVVIDPAFTETAQVADYVLPAAAGYEKWEHAGFPKGYPHVSAQVRPPVVRGPDEALPEAEIYHRLAREMGIAPKAPRALHLLAKGARSPLGAPLYFAALGSLAAMRGGSGKAIAARFVFWLYETLGPLLPSPQLVAIWGMAHAFAATRKADVVRQYSEVARMKNPFAVGEFLFQKILDHPEG